MSFFKKNMSVVKFIFIITIFNMLIYHVPFYSYAVSDFDALSLNGILTLASLTIALFVVMVFALLLFSIISVQIVKYFTIIMVLGNSIALYFMNTYNVILDKTMMGNVFNTNSTEAMSYYDPKIFIYFIFFGIIPAFLISKINIISSKRLYSLYYAFGILLTGLFLLYLNSATWLWLDKRSKVMGGLSMPWSYMINPIRYKLKLLKKSKKQILLPNGKLVDNDKMVVILVIGESARKANFSLYGYKKKTNPLLEKQSVVVLKNATSSATYTTASTSSMLSFDASTSSSYEPLPSYLERFGVDVIWRSNNWGAPSEKVRLYQRSGDIKCKGEKCNHDEVLLEGLTKIIKNSKRNKIFIVLHTAGSHGPTYYKKYPKKFEIFKPVCKTVNLKQCTNQELINAYDNTIVYTDYFLDKTIKALQKIKEIPSLMIYLSDHGESLGEYGLYMHGAPYSIAPDFQKEIPFILWESKSFLAKKGFDKPYVKKQSAYGQENVFHTIMGAFDMKSPIYNKKLDLLNQ